MNFGESEILTSLIQGIHPCLPRRLNVTLLNTKRIYSNFQLHFITKKKIYLQFFFKNKVFEFIPLFFIVLSKIWQHLNLPGHIERRCHAGSAASLCVTFCSPGLPPGSRPRQRRAQKDLRDTDCGVSQGEATTGWTSRGMCSFYWSREGLK